MSALMTSAPLNPPTAVVDHDPADPGLDEALRLFLAQRTRLFRIAYRVVGDVGRAEDVVQDAWVRWQRADRARIKNPAAFLTTTTTHLAINVVSSARHRHEAPVESSLASLHDAAPASTGEAERFAATEEALEPLLARLSPGELAAYLLRKGFDHPYPRIAALLRTSVPNARQLVRRAQLRIADPPVRTVDAEVHRRLIEVFLAAARTGEIGALEALLAETARSSTMCVPPVEPSCTRRPVVRSRSHPRLTTAA